MRALSKPAIKMVSVVAILIVLLAGCSNAVSVKPFDLTAPGAIVKMACGDVAPVLLVLNEKHAAPVDSGKHRELLQWGLNPSDEDQYNAILSQLGAKAVACKQAPSAVPSSSASTPSATASAACDAKFVQTVVPDPILGRFIVDGLKGTADEKKAQVIDALGHNYLYLDLVGEALFGGTIDEKSLITPDGTCLSDAGKTLFNRASGAIMVTKAANTTANSGYNTAIVNGQVVVDSTPGIRGNASAVQFVDENGNVVLVVLDRCANVVLPSPPGHLPKGPTDNPPPPTPPCPPGQVMNDNGKCVTPKNTADQPENKGNIPPQIMPSATATVPVATSAPSVTKAPSTATYTPPAQPAPTATATTITAKPTATRTSVPPPPATSTATATYNPTTAGSCDPNNPACG